MVELVDTRDLKSLGPKTVRVRFPLAAPFLNCLRNQIQKNKVRINKIPIQFLLSGNRRKRIEQWISGISGSDLWKHRIWESEAATPMRCRFHRRDLGADAGSGLFQTEGHQGSWYRLPSRDRALPFSEVKQWAHPVRFEVFARKHHQGAEHQAIPADSAV